MDPTQNQSGTPGPIFSAGPAPEEPSMASAPSGSGPKNPFPRGGDIVLQPSNDYYSGGAKPRSKKPIIIIGAIAVVAIIVLLTILSTFNRSSISNSDKKEELYMDAIGIRDSYSQAVDMYDSLIGFNGDSLIKNPNSILFYSPEMYEMVYENSNSAINLINDSKSIAEESNLYKSEITSISDSVQEGLNTLKQNAEVMKNLNYAFILPIRNAENWQYSGCVSSPEAKALLSNSDKKLAAIAQKYNQLACKDDMQIGFEGEVIPVPKSVDDSTAEILNGIAKSLSNYFGTVNLPSKDEILDKLNTIIESTKPDENNDSNAENSKDINK